MTQIQIDENTLRKIVREEIREGVDAITGPKFDEMNDRFDHVDKRLDNIEGDVAEIRLRQSITDKKLDAAIEEFKDQEERLTKVEKEVNKYK